MTRSDDFWRAVQDAKLTFPTLASLGSGDPPAAWLAARNAAKSTGRAAVLITSSGSEGSSGSGQRNFDQNIVVDALDYRRHQLDSTYTLPPHLATDDSAPATLRFRPAAEL